MTVMGPDRVIPRPVGEEPAEAAPVAAAAPKRRTGLLVGAAAAVVVAIVGGVLLLGGDDGGDDVDGRVPVTRPERADVDLTNVSDDQNVITVGVIDDWDDVDGRPLDDGAGNLSPDIIAAEDADTFLAAGGFATSGIEVTVIEGATDATALLADRVGGRALDEECTTDLPPGDANVAGFSGLLQRFEGCDGNALVVFAGVSGGRGLVAEVHLVEQEDEDALDAVLDSIAVT